MIGFKIISEMSKEELVEEILETNRAKLNALDMTNLKASVINLRMDAYRENLAREAGLTIHNGVMGSYLADPDEITE